jgi:hypothetical protein
MMTICQHCGVELEENMNYCPLCGQPVEPENSPATGPVRIRTREDLHKRYSRISQLNTSQKRKLIWEVSSIVLLSGILGVMLLNLIFNQSLSWAVYPLVLGLSVFAYITLFIYWTGKRWKKVSGSFVVTFLMLFFIDYASRGIDWALFVALPLLVGICIIGMGLYLVARQVKYYGFNLLAYVFLGLAVFLMLLEGTLSYYHQQALTLDWSIIVLISFLPVDAVLFYIHFRLKKNPDLKKFFHI